MFYAVERWQKILRQLCRTLEMKFYFLWWIKVGILVIIPVLILLNFAVFQMTNEANLIYICLPVPVVPKKELNCLMLRVFKEL